MERDACVNPLVGPLSPLEMRDGPMLRGITRRQAETPGYTTTDDFGTDGLSPPRELYTW